MSLQNITETNLNRDKGIAKDSPTKLFENPDNKNLLTAFELALMLNVSVTTIRKWRYEKRFPAKSMLKISRSVRYIKSEVIRWLQQQQESQ